MEIKYNGKKYIVDFNTTVHADVRQDSRFVTTCTIINERHQVFTGAAVKAPGDEYASVIGQKTALRRAFGDIYDSANGTHPWPRAWEEFRIAVLGAEPG